MSKKKRPQHDPQWAKAKEVCRLNQQDIAMAKELGMTPKSLMKNNPSPSQKWKQPVKYWLRGLHEKRFGQRDPSKVRLVESLEQHSPNNRRSRNRNRVPMEDEIDPWDDDFENFHDFAGAMLPQIEFTIPLEQRPDDPEWEKFRRGKRQRNLCWMACSLTARMREVPAVERITVFGSVAMSVRRPFGQPWDGPEAAAMCHTLNLAVWINAADQGTLCSLDMIVRQTLASLADIECITLSRDRLEILHLEAVSNRFLGLLLPAATAEIAPTLDVPPGYVFRIEPLREPQAIVTFERAPTKAPASAGHVEDDDIPF